MRSLSVGARHKDGSGAVTPNGRLISPDSFTAFSKSGFDLPAGAEIFLEGSVNCAQATSCPATAQSVLLF